ncbi:MAG: GNAT family N-acetyltransferase [Actinomycetota bacterium]|nr:GNAT family N-acetyltransferase [Actinomycetota bacterium]
MTADWNEIVRFVWRDPGLHVQDDGRIVEHDGVPVAFAGVFREDDDASEPFGSWMAFPPADRTGGALPFVVDWLVARARERGARSLRHLVYRNDDAHRTVALERGFRRVRSSWTMHRQIGPDGPIEGPPDGIRFTTLAEHPDELGLYRADQEAFAEHFGFSPESFEVWRQRRFDADDDDRSRWLLALEGAETVAFLRQVTGGEVAQVAALGTRKAWRGRGIGSALLRRAFAEMADAGHREVTLWVDAENETGAVGLYERVGMRPIVVDDTYQLELGP